MANKLILRSKNSPFVAPFSDINLGSVLSHPQLDDNFIYLKGNLIYTGTTSGTTLTLHKINNERIDLDLSGLVITGGTPDTYTTGGTVSYINENGSVIYTRSDGSTFLVTGFTDSNVTGGTYSNSTGDITFTKNDGTIITVDLSSMDLNDTYTTGTTLVGPTLYFNTTESLSAYTADLSPLLDTNFYTTGSTLIGTIAYFDRTDSLSAYTLDLSTFNTDNFYVTGGTVIGSTMYLNRTDTLSAATIDVSSLLDNTDTFITGMTFNNGTYDLTIDRNDGVSFTDSLSILSGDMVVTGGTYDINTGIVTFTNNSGGTFNVSGFTSGMTDSFTSTAYTVGNEIRFDNNIQGINLYNVDLSPVLSGFTTGATSPFEYATGSTTSIQPIVGNNTASGTFSTIGGGFSNVVSGVGLSTIGGGINNTASGSTSTIGGGFGNASIGSLSVIGGGSGNVSSGSSSTIGGGNGNVSSGLGTFIGGGENNIISGVNDSHSVIGGGYNNYIGGGSGSGSRYSMIGTGKINNIGQNCLHTFISNGNSNTIESGTTYSNIIGGRLNVIKNAGVSRDNGNIFGGLQNIINENAPNGTIIGGILNVIQSGHTNTQILGSNITSVSADTAHVDRLNLSSVDTGSTSTEVLVREADGMINTVEASTLTGGIGGKFVINFTFTAATTSTITHNLGSTDVLVQIKDSTGQLITPNTVNNYTINSVDINVSSTEIMRVIIIG